MGRPTCPRLVPIVSPASPAALGSTCARSDLPRRPPLRTGTQREHRCGLFARSPVTDAMTIAGTLHADFSEVEADENQLNLTRFPLFLPEKRDFFLEDAGLFNFGVLGEAELFFSRTIGLISDSTGETATVPIEWGAKATGRRAESSSACSPVPPNPRLRRRRTIRRRSGALQDLANGRRWAASGAAATPPIPAPTRPSAPTSASSCFMRSVCRASWPATKRASGRTRRLIPRPQPGRRADCVHTLRRWSSTPGSRRTLGLVARPGTRRVEASATVPWFPTKESGVRRYAPSASYVRYDNVRQRRIR